MYDLYKELGYGQYIWNGVLDELRSYIASIPDGETLDIRKCRFDPSCISVVMNNIPRINVVNSEEADMDFILQHNRKVRMMDKVSVVRKDIKAEFYDEDGKRIDDFMEDFMVTPKEVVWQIPNGGSSSKFEYNYYNMLIGLLMQFPKRLFDIHHEAPATFAKHVQHFFTIDDYQTSDCILATLGGGAFMYFNFRDDSREDVHITGIGTITIDSLISKYNALPGWVGREKILGTDRQSILEKVYSEVKFADRIEADSGVKTISGYIAKYGGL